jgi:transcriptional regulator with XRE-family HTH domain
MEKFYQRLKHLREKRGFTMKALAKRIGVPASTYRDWEYGGSIRGDAYLKLAEALNIGLYELMTGKEPNYGEIQEILLSLEKNVNDLKISILPILEIKRRLEK